MRSLRLRLALLLVLPASACLVQAQGSRVLTDNEALNLIEQWTHFALDTINRTETHIKKLNTVLLVLLAANLALVFFAVFRAFRRN